MFVVILAALTAPARNVAYVLPLFTVPAAGAAPEGSLVSPAAKLKVPEGTQSGTQFRIRHKGVPILNSHSRGDLYVHIDVKIPAKLTREQKKLLEQLRETLPADNQPAEKGLFEKVKDYFA